jgi:hypothetical protein
LLGGIGPLLAPLHLIMDKAYEDQQTRQLTLNSGFIPMVPPHISIPHLHIGGYQCWSLLPANPATANSPL